MHTLLLRVRFSSVIFTGSVGDKQTTPSPFTRAFRVIQHNVPLHQFLPSQLRVDPSLLLYPGIVSFCLGLQVAKLCRFAMVSFTHLLDELYIYILPNELGVIMVQFHRPSSPICDPVDPLSVHVPPWPTAQQHSLAQTTSPLAPLTRTPCSDPS